MIPKRLILAIALLTFGSRLAAGKVIQPDDKSGDNIRAAATQFLNDLADGKEKETRAEFVGNGESAKMLDRFITSVSLGREMMDALRAKFPNDAGIKDIFSPDDSIRASAKAIATESITVADNGTHASIAAASPGVFGVELTSVNGKWKVSYPLSLHGKNEEMGAATLDAVNAILPPIIARVKKGDFATSDAAMSALERDAISTLQTMATTRPALKVIGSSTTQPAQQ